MKTTLLPNTHSHISPSLTRAPGPGRNSPRDSARLATSGFPWNTVEDHGHQAPQTHPSTCPGPQPASTQDAQRPRFPLDCTLCPSQPSSLSSVTPRLSAFSGTTAPATSRGTHSPHSIGRALETSRFPFPLDKQEAQSQTQAKCYSQWGFYHPPLLF